MKAGFAEWPSAVAGLTLVAALGVTPAVAQSGYADQYGQGGTGGARSGAGYADQYGPSLLRPADKDMGYADQYGGRTFEAQPRAGDSTLASPSAAGSSLGALDPMNGLGPGYDGSPGAAAVAGSRNPSTPFGGPTPVYNAGRDAIGVDQASGRPLPSQPGALGNSGDPVGEALLGGLTPGGATSDPLLANAPSAGRADDQVRSGSGYADQYVKGSQDAEDGSPYANPFRSSSTPAAKAIAAAPSIPHGAPASRGLQAKDEQTPLGALRDLFRNARAAIRGW